MASSLPTSPPDTPRRAPASSPSLPRASTSSSSHQPLPDAEFAWAKDNPSSSVSTRKDWERKEGEVQGCGLFTRESEVHGESPAEMQGIEAAILQLIQQDPWQKLWARTYHKPRKSNSDPTFPSNVFDTVEADFVWHICLPGGMKVRDLSWTDPRFRITTGDAPQPTSSPPLTKKVSDREVCKEDADQYVLFEITASKGKDAILHKLLQLEYLVLSQRRVESLANEKPKSSAALVRLLFFVSFHIVKGFTHSVFETAGNLLNRGKVPVEAVIKMFTDTAKKLSKQQKRLDRQGEQINQLQAAFARKAAKAAKKQEREETAVIIEGQKEMIAIAKKENIRLANLEMLAIVVKDISNLPDDFQAFYQRKQRKYMAEMSEDEEDIGDQDQRSILNPNPNQGRPRPHTDATNA
ncbi:hypothetical protein BDK51DRAFT_29280 [Blyttiomyces helicus]|uniref:Uncharacterized protein n=1 Tax=Blyttiomyces helicus TaxID=388810 RepID=A0A4P9WLL2_9FUNG|nr:hypothetical protein BDK51DRAFT_29280 [Blyttiomyces helicus]|eukprot:RKO92518.1 hypothetical protein BDK51DRAFT_29280 [Blyttiomyces helicus]